MKLKQSLLVTIMIVSLAFIPVRRAEAGPGLFELGAAAVATTSFAVAHPIIITGGAILVATGTAYTVYKGGKAAKDALMTVVPYAVIPFANTKLANVAIEEDKPGTLDYSISLSSIFKKVPFIGGYFGLNLGEQGQLHQAIAADKDVSHVMIERAGEVNIDINKQFGETREVPLGVALRTEHDEISERLLRQPQLDLRQQSDVTTQDWLYHKVIKSGKTELTDLAIERGKEGALQNVADAHGENLAHLAAVSPGLRKIIEDKGVQFSEEAYNRANEAGKTPIEIAVFSYQKGEGVTDADTVQRFIDAPHNVEVRDNTLFFESLRDPELHRRGIPTTLLGKGAVTPAMAVPTGETPLDLAIKAGDDALALALAKKTEAHVQPQLGHALLKGMTETTRYLGEKLQIFGESAKREAQLQFFRDPLQDGKSVLAHMVESSPDKFDSNQFIDAYRVLKTIPNTNPLDFQTKYMANLLESAAIAGNEQAVRTIFGIIIDEGWMNNISVLTANQHSVVPMLIVSGKAPVLAEELAKLPPGDQTVAQSLLLGGAERTGKLQVETKEIPLRIEDSKTGEGILIVQGSGRALVALPDGKVLTVSPEFVRQHEEKLEKIEQMERVKQEEQEHREEAAITATREKEKEGIPKEIKASPIIRQQRIPVPIMRQSALVSGYFATNIIDNRGALQYMVLIAPGMDQLVDRNKLQDLTNNHELAWAMAYFVASLAMSYGANTNLDLFSTTNLKNAGLNLAAYSAKRYFHGTPNIEELPTPDQRNVYDFVSHFGSAMASDVAWSVIRTGLIIYITGATMGVAGIAVPALLTLGTDFLSYYNVYYASTGTEVQSWDSYLIPYLIAALTTVGYVSSVSSYYMADVGAVSSPIQTIQAVFGAFVTFATTHRLSSLVYENFGKPVVSTVARTVKSVAHTTSDYMSWIYKKAFSNTTTIEEEQEL